MGGTLTVLTLPLLVFTPVPVLNGFLAAQVGDAVAARLACPGKPGPEARVEVGGGAVLSQLARGRLSRIRVTVPDAAVGGARHAALDATLTGVTGFTSDTPKAASLTSSTTIRFADMPAPPTGPRPTFGYTDGSLTVTVPTSPERAKNVTATLYLALRLQGESIVATPQRLLLFKRMLPATNAAGVAGGSRTTPLPHLPDGLKYTSVSARADGLHVGLNGVVVTPLSALPTTSGGRTVSYSSRGGLLGISSQLKVPLILDETITIWAAPRLDGNRLTMVPQSVEVLGSSRPTDDPIAAIVLSQVDSTSLTRTLPTLPAGVRYRSVSVDPTGVKVAVGGESVKPYAQLPQPPGGLPTTFGQEGGLLTASTKGLPADGPRSTLTLYAAPRISGTTLDLSPQRIALFGTLFPAGDVLAQIGTEGTTFPLQALPQGMAYSGVEVLPTGLRVLVGGKDVALARGLPGQGCPAS